MNRGLVAVLLVLLTGSLSAQTKVVLLGTGFPRPDPNAWGPATAVVVGDRTFLVDAGVGVERRMAAAHLPINGPTAVFITHLHSDHTLGLADLILTSWVMQRRGPLQVYGPAGLQPMTDHLLAAYAVDEKARIEDLEHESGDNLRVAVHEIAAGVVYDSAGVKVTAFRVLHGPLEAYGYRFDTPGRVVVISGDTRPSEELVKASAGADVLVHEVYSGSHLKVEDRPGGADWPTYMKSLHTSDVELGLLAERIHPKLLVLTHIIRMGATDEEMLAAVRQTFKGEVVMGRDLGEY
ncbi:MAG TPA: MBL fold metallo-hydrolase [Gemmatimonadales bacterium]|nr:MBL fold metallo-hydrolase [Gemmatimonadales bacterium]